MAISSGSDPWCSSVTSSSADSPGRIDQIRVLYTTTCGNSVTSSRLHIVITISRVHLAAGLR
jgi:hypothetical protein